VLDQQQQQELQHQFYDSGKNGEYDQFKEELKRLLPMAKNAREVIEAEVTTALKVSNIKNIDPDFLVEAIMSDPEIYENSQLVSDLLQKEISQ
jgi:hypothetical protein